MIIKKPDTKQLMTHAHPEGLTHTAGKRITQQVHYVNAVCLVLFVVSAQCRLRDRDRAGLLASGRRSRGKQGRGGGNSRYGNGKGRTNRPQVDLVDDSSSSDLFSLGSFCVCVCEVARLRVA